MGVETAFAIASTLALIVGLILAAAFLSPRFGEWMAVHTGRISPRLGRLFREGLGGGDS
jgi:hypothetical protein